MSNWPLHDSVRYEAFGRGTSGSNGFSAGASAHTKGAWNELITSISFGYSGIDIQVQDQTGGDVSALFDIAVGASGSEVVVVENILLDKGDRSFKVQNFRLPLAIPAGSRLAARAQTDTGGDTVRLGGMGWGTGFASPWFAGYPAVITMGADTADTAGTQVDPGGTTETKGAWSEIEDSVARDLAGLAIAIGMQRNPDPGVNGMLFDIGVGGAGSEVVLIPDLVQDTRTISGFGWNDPMLQGWFPCQVPAGSRLAVRAASFTADATDRLRDVVLYGIAA